MSSRYHYTFDVTDESTAARVCRLAGAKGGTLLELGCAAGAMTEVLSQHYGCSVTGVEYDALVAEAARKCAERVIVADLNAPDWDTGLDPAGYDTVVAADVLEHLADPASCLQIVRKYLKKDGKLVISVPNIAHSGVLAALLNNDFPYRDTGLLDRTHTHFFTSLTLARMLSQTGFAVEKIEYVTAGRWHEEFAQFWQQLPAELIRLLESNPAGRAFQIVALARPTDSSVEYSDQTTEDNLNWFNTLQVSGAREDTPPNTGNTIGKDLKQASIQSLGTGSGKTLAPSVPSAFKRWLRSIIRGAGE